MRSVRALGTVAIIFSAMVGCKKETPPPTQPTASTVPAEIKEEFDVTGLEKKWPSKNKLVKETRADGSIVISLAEYPKSRYDPRGRPDFASGDWIVDNLGAQPSVITPYIEKENGGSVVQGNVLESLLSRDLDTFEWLPLLAESYEQKPDHVTFLFTLRKNAKWSDGTPVTVDDVIFSFNTVMEEGVDSDRAKSYYGRVASVKKIGDRTVEWKFKEPYFQALEQAGGLVIVPEHVYAHKTAEEFNKKNDLLVGSGPYTFDKSQWKRGEQIILLRNENYWGDKPTFDRIVYKFIQNPTAAFQAFQNGDLDEFTPLPEQYDTFSKDPKFTSKFACSAYYVPTAGYRYIGWNEKKPMFADKATRQALTMLIDRKTIIDTTAYGLACETTGPFSPMTKQNNADIKPMPFDPKAAQKLLADAGWKLNANNILVRDGVEFRFDITIPTDSPVYEKTCELIKNQLSKAGIIMNITPFEWSVMVDRLDVRNFDATMLGWTGGIEEDPYQIWHSDSIKDKGSNFVSWSNPEADKLIVAGRGEMDEAKRMEIWHKLHAIIHEEQPYTFLTFSMDRSFIQKRFQNVVPTRTGLSSSDWYVPVGQQKYH